MFAQVDASDILARWDDRATPLAERFPRAAEILLEAIEGVLAFRHFPAPHWRNIWSTNLGERVYVAPEGALGNAPIKRHTQVVGIFPNDAAISSLEDLPTLEAALDGLAASRAQAIISAAPPQASSCRQHSGPPDERLDKSIVRIHGENTRCKCT